MAAVCSRSARITATFDMSRDVDLALQDIQARVASAQRSLPKDVPAAIGPARRRHKPLPHPLPPLRHRHPRRRLLHRRKVAAHRTMPRLRHRPRRVSRLPDARRVNSSPASSSRVRVDAVMGAQRLGVTVP